MDTADDRNALGADVAGALRTEPSHPSGNSRPDISAARRDDCSRCTAAIAYEGSSRFAGGSLPAGDWRRSPVVSIRARLIMSAPEISDSSERAVVGCGE